MTTRQKVDALRDQLAKAWIEKDGLRVLELQNALRELERRLNMEIDLKVAQCYMAARNLTKVELS